MNLLEQNTEEKKLDSVRVVIDPTLLPQGKNVSGENGEKCNNCGGYGYTIGLNGKSIDCTICETTGIKMPTKLELLKEIQDIKKDLSHLRKAILETLEEGGFVIKTKVAEEK